MAHQRTNTRRLEFSLNSLEKEFRGLCSKDALRHRKNALKRAKGSQHPSKLKKLLDVYDLLGIPYEMGQSDEYYLRLSDGYSFDSGQELEAKMLKALYKRFEVYPPSSFYLQRTVNDLREEEDASWADQPLRVQILRQFVKYGDCLRAAGYGGKRYLTTYVRTKSGQKTLALKNGIDYIDDAVFAPLADAKSSELKPRGCYGLLRAVDDLARARFRAQGVTRRTLYYFAIVNNMTYYTHDDAAYEMRDDKSDIETNLFQDYYENNLMRFLCDPEVRNDGGLKIVPSGRGINYKNFAEMVYLYYIHQDGLTRPEKIERAEAMIERIRTECRSKGPSENVPDLNTQIYKGYFNREQGRILYLEDALSLNEAEFEEFLKDNYNCDIDTVSNTARTPSVMELGIEQNSAARVYQKILLELDERGMRPQDCRSGLWFADVDFLDQAGTEYLMEIVGGTKERTEQFRMLLHNMNDFVRHSVLNCPVQLENENAPYREEIPAGTDDSENEYTESLFVDPSKEMSRTTLLVAVYYLFNERHAMDPKDQWVSFGELFAAFKQEADVFLTEAGYQPLSGRSQFDVLLAFSAYAVLNL